ncbi:hypothetical protein [Echinicola salinicaeni]|uniref:hypothetical protein n=1 Tax=Echinicola salinicaeni TaxID=2762757 RepID=UPI00164738E8|nr:hypothetical protein [Echinicola salinicaeni]
MEEIVRIHVKLLSKETGKPLSGKAYRVKFYDKDAFKDDLLGESDLTAQGMAILSISKKDYTSLDSPFEEHPDIYFVLYKEGKEIYKSPVAESVHLEDQLGYPDTLGLDFDMGSFLV